MARIDITGFSGEQPRVLPSLLPDAGAQEAWNARLDDGGLTPTRKSKKVGEVPVGHRTVYRHQGVWLTRPGVVQFVPGAVAQDRLYSTGDGVPKMLVAGIEYPLAVPRPAGALTATAAGTGTGNIATRLYVYTSVTDFGEESEPSPASNDVNWQAGQTITLTGFASPPAGRAITKQRIYRSQTGKAGTYLYFIAERAASNAPFADTVPVDQFKEPLPSADWNAPPDELSGLVAMQGGMMAAFVGRKVYFSEPWRPHAWPEKYVITVDTPVVGLGAIGSSLLIMTEGQPYIAAGQHPSQMVQQRIQANLPCINARAIANLGFAVCYPSVDGLVALRADGAASVVTANLFRREDWLALSPATAVAGQLAGRYVYFYDILDPSGDRRAGAFAIDLGGTAFLVRHSVQASAAWHDVTTSRLYYVQPDSGDLLEFQPVDTAPGMLAWTSKEFVLPSPQNLGVLLVDSAAQLSLADRAALAAERAALIAELAAALPTSDLGAPVNVRLVNEMLVGGDDYTYRTSLDNGEQCEVIVKADGRVVATARTLDTPVRLKAGFLARNWELAVRTNVSVKRITMASTMADLRGG